MRKISVVGIKKSQSAAVRGEGRAGCASLDPLMINISLFMFPLTNKILSTNIALVNHDDDGKTKKVKSNLLLLRASCYKYPRNNSKPTKLYTTNTNVHSNPHKYTQNNELKQRHHEVHEQLNKHARSVKSYLPHITVNHVL